MNKKLNKRGLINIPNEQTSAASALLGIIKEKLVHQIKNVYRTKNKENNFMCGPFMTLPRQVLEKKRENLY
jgi:hypothetical protein